MTLDQLPLILSALEGHGLSINQWKVLLKLKEGGIFTMSELAQECQFSTAACTVCIDALEGKTLVTRQHSKEDRRKIMVKITPQGSKTLQDLNRTLSGS